MSQGEKIDEKWYNPPVIGYEDMTTMENMTLDGVLENLKDRFHEDLIYVGHSLLPLASFLPIVTNL